MTIENERAVQNRVIALMRTKLGFGYWGNLKDQDNTNINANVLSEFLEQHERLSPGQISSVTAKLKQAAHCTSKSALYNANKAVYQMLRSEGGSPALPSNNTTKERSANF